MKKHLFWWGIIASLVGVTASLASSVEAQAYAHRVRLKILSEKNLPAGALISVKLNTKRLLAAKRLLPDAADLRVWYWTGKQLQEVPRQVILPNYEFTTVKFALTTAIAANTPDFSYLLSYGQPTATAPQEPDWREPSAATAQVIGQEFRGVEQTEAGDRVTLEAGQPVQQAFRTAPWMKNISKVELCVAYRNERTPLLVTLAQPDPEALEGIRVLATSRIEGPDIPRSLPDFHNRGHYWVPFDLHAAVEPETTYLLQVAVAPQTGESYRLVAANTEAYRAGSLTRGGKLQPGMDLCFAVYGFLPNDDNPLLE